MKCPMQLQDSKELLLSYSAGRMSAESAAALEAHMDSCAACGEFRDGQRALWETLGEWEARPVSADFDRRLYSRIEEREQMGWWGRTFGSLRPVLFRPALPMAATACLMLAAGFISMEPGRVAAPVAESSPAPEVELVESALEDLEMLRQFDLGAKVEGGSHRM